MTENDSIQLGERGEFEELSGELNHREIMVAMSGVMLGMFVALMSGSVVVNALPRIIPDLGGGQTGFTWVITAAFLTLTASTPLWGKLADIINLKRLVQVALLLYVVGSLGGAVAQNMGMLIAARAVIGLGIGGLSTLSQAVIAQLVPPRQRGKYAGYLGISYALGTVSGPLVGGLIADSALGWRGCFFVPVPLAVLSLLLMQRTLRIAHTPIKARIDYVGGTMVVGSISLLLVLLSLGGSSISWGSPASFALGIGGVAGVIGALAYEAKVPAAPVIRLALFRLPTVALIACTAPLVGVIQFGATVYLTEYYQYAHGLNPTQAGLLTVPMVLGLTITGILGGRYVANTGSWKTVALLGIALSVAGAALIGTMDKSTPVLLVSAFSFVLGIGMGGSSQNLILAVQNVVDDTEVASATSLVTFCQSLGGTTGITILGSVLSHKIAQALPDLGGSLPKPSLLPPAVRERYQDVMGDGLGDLFMLMAPAAALGLVACYLVPRATMRVHRHLEGTEV